MGKCDLCGQSAGLLRGRHKECQAKHDAGLRDLREVASQRIASGDRLESLPDDLEKIARPAFITDTQIRNAVVAVWEQALDGFLDDDVLSEEEEGRLTAFAKAAGLEQEALNGSGAFDRMVKAALLRELSRGKLPQPQHIVGYVPFNFMKSEQLVWLFQDVKYYEERTRREFRGGHQGVSIRVTKGVYYRTGSFRGHPVETTRMEHLDTGLLGVTTKHLYFSGSRKKFRVKFDKIVEFDPYDDGIGIQRDAASARPQVFVTGDGWFTMNLVQIVSRA